GEFEGAVGPAVAVVIAEQAQITAPRNEDLSAGAQRHAEDVVGEVAVGELRDGESRQRSQAQGFVLGTGARKGWEHGEGGNGEDKPHGGNLGNGEGHRFSQTCYTAGAKRRKAADAMEPSLPPRRLRRGEPEYHPCEERVLCDVSVLAVVWWPWS